MSDVRPRWEQRFVAPKVGMPTWSRHAPDRIVFASTESGTWEVHAWDRAAGTRRQVTDSRVGITDGTPTADGKGIVWFDDDTGDESGRWMVQPFAGGESRPFLEGVPDGWNEGLSLGLDRAVAAVSDRDGFAIYVTEAGDPGKEIARSVDALRMAGTEAGGFNLGGLSADEILVCLEHSDHGDLIHPALRVIDTRTGAVVGEQWDGEGLGLHGAVWSPLPGDQRLVIIHERGGDDRAAIWDLATGERRDLEIDLPAPGMFEVHDWWPDGSALLLLQLFEGRDRLYRYDLRTGAVAPIDHPEGSIFGARVRPDGRVWFRQSSGAHEPRVLSDASGNAEVLAPQGSRAPDGEPYRSWFFANPHGQRVQGFHVTPPGEGPFPTIMLVHGGPTWLDTDRFSPDVQAYVDHGFAVAMVNYRGSTGYGSEWRDVLIGNIGFPEIEDVIAGLDDLVDRGVADPDRTVVAGWSWGGYTTLLMLGTHPGRFAAGVAGVPVADYAASYDDMSPILQAYDRALLGGPPVDVPQLMKERSPIEYVDDVTEPVLILAGENDSRCPIRQIMNYVERLRARDHPHELYLYDTGHSSFDMEEEVRQMRVVLDFLRRHVPGVS